MQWGRTALQFAIGGITVVAASSLSNMKGNVGVFLGSMLSTIPVQDMLPVVFIDTLPKAKSYAIRNCVSNVAVVLGMMVLFFCLKSKMAKPWAVTTGVGTWLVVAVAAQLLTAEL